MLKLHTKLNFNICRCAESVGMNSLIKRGHSNIYFILRYLFYILRHVLVFPTFFNVYEYVPSAGEIFINV